MAMIVVKRLFTRSLMNQRFARQKFLPIRLISSEPIPPPPPLESDSTGPNEQRWVLKPQKITKVSDEETWVAKDFSDQDVNEMNRRLKESNNRKLRSTGPSSEDATAPPLSSIRGFLELNPHVCSGCGIQFQSKLPDAPGFLSKEKLADHRIRAERIKQQQDALKLLDMASINVESQLAREVLKAGNVPDDIIESVIELGRVRGGVNVKSVFGESGETDSLTDSLPSTSHTSRFDENAKSTIDSDLPSKTKNQQQVSQEDPIGYHPTTLKPIYDVEELRLSFLDMDLDPKAKYRKFDKSNKQVSIDEEDVPSEGVSSTVGVDAAIPVCQRCFRLQVYGECDEQLRPGWSHHELLTPSRFQELLSGIKESKCVVLCLIDLYDIEGSVVSNLKDIAGKNPIVIAANKIDLLPKDASTNRVNDWVHGFVKHRCKLLTPKETEEADKKLLDEKGWFPSRKNSEAGMLRRSNVHLVSCDTGTGLKELMSSVSRLAKEHGDKVYVMGTANVGKSSFINRLLRFSKKQKGKSAHSRKKQVVPQATVSSLPGTTLDFLKIKLPNGLTVIDTPGLINPGQVTTKLNSAELRQVIPTKRVNHITLRMEPGRSVLIGALARFDLVEGPPMMCTFFMSNMIHLHPTSTARAEELLQQHDGSLIFPPSSLARLQEIGPWEDSLFDVEGDSWKRASCDIAIGGLGWLSMTGPGKATVRVSAPVGTAIRARPPLMPFEAKKTSVRHTGSRFVKKGAKGGVGWRA